MWLVECVFGCCSKWVAVVEVAKCVAVRFVAKWTSLVVVAESVVGGPRIQPCFED